MVGEVSEQDGKASVAQISEHGLVGGKSVNATAIDRGPESESQQQEKAI
jgi:hypothetical protein